MKFACVVSMLLHNQPAVCSTYVSPLFETLPVTIMTLNTIVNQIFFRTGMKLASCLSKKAHEMVWSKFDFMGEQLENSEVTILEAFLRAIPANDVYEITGGGSTSAVTWEMRAGGERPVTIKIYELTVLLSLRILSFLWNTEGLNPLRFGTAMVTTAPGYVHHYYLDTWDHSTGLGSTPLPQDILKVPQANLDRCT